jgi:hypothetical protein
MYVALKPISIASALYSTARERDIDATPMGGGSMKVGHAKGVATPSSHAF